MTRVTLSKPVVLGPIEIRVIERMWISAPAKCGGAMGFAAKEPVAVLIQDETGVRAMNPRGEEIPLRQLGLQYPGLDLND
jgi:hypothetical protein